MVMRLGERERGGVKKPSIVPKVNLTTNWFRTSKEDPINIKHMRSFEKNSFWSYFALFVFRILTILQKCIQS